MSKMKKYMPRIVAGILCLLMVGGIVSVAAYTAGAEGTETTGVAASDGEKASSDKGGELYKEETVYVIADAEGAPKKIIVSDWIKNPEKLSTINDKTNLENVKNVKGDETFTLNDSNMCVWDAEGNDIYYQGQGNDSLPVDLSVSYELNGVSVSPDKLNGKSGKLKIRYDYRNNQYETVKINGVQRKIYVPFVMLTGMILDNDYVRNVEVSSGKVINDGSHTIVAGFALPGMSESLALNTKEFEIPDYVEITADVTDFEVGTTITLATNDMFSDIDFSKFDGKIKDLKKKLDALVAGVNQLVDGSSQLYNGISTLAEKSKELIAGVRQLADGSEKLSDGAKDLAKGTATLDVGVGTLLSGISELDNGAVQLHKGVKKLDSGIGSLYAGTKTLSSGAVTLDNGAGNLQYGINQLADGLAQLSGNSSALNGGAKEVFETLLKTAETQLTAAGLEVPTLTVDNFADVLDNVETSLDSDTVYQLAYNTARETVSATVNAQKDLIKGQVEAAVRQQVLEAVLAQSGLGLTVEQYSAAVSGGQIDDATQAQINGAVDNQMASDEIKSTVNTQTQAQIDSLIETNMQSDEVTAQINAAVAKASAGAESIKQLKKQLNSFNEFYQGILKYTAGVDSANDGAAQLAGGSSSLKDGTDKLRNGSSDLKKGAKKLKKGSGKLADATKKLKSGTAKLKNGAAALKDGTSKLRDGASKLSSGADTLFGGLDKLRTATVTLEGGVNQLRDGSFKLKNGIAQLNEEGVSSIEKLVNGGAKELIERLKAVSKVSSDYKSYGGISDDMKGKVDFIYKTDLDKKDK